MSEAQWDKDDQRWADVAHIAAAVKRHLEVRAYLLTGGSDGCAACRGLSTVERVTKGGPHVECAENGIASAAAKLLAAVASDFDLHIAIARAFEDPRMFQWLTTAPAGGDQ